MAVVLVTAGILLPALGPPLETPPEGVIGMSHHGYITVQNLADYDEEAAEAEAASGRPPVVTIRVGDTLTLQNNSRWIHIVGSGDKGLLVPPGTSAMTPRKMMEENESYTTPPWRTPGEYAITCTVHPLMNATVVVLP